LTKRTDELRKFFQKKYPEKERTKGLFKKMNKYTEVIHCYITIIDFEKDNRFVNVLKNSLTGKIYSLNRELKELGVPTKLLLTLEDLK